jgi:hypothetical protein
VPLFFKNKGMGIPTISLADNPPHPLEDLKYIEEQSLKRLLET